jgi:hypothetical protein
MRIITAVLLSLFVACSSTGMRSGTDSQVVVDSVAKQNPGLLRLTVHCMQNGKAMACASTVAAKKGKPSDPEDVQAMTTGKTVVLDEANAIDVTVPMRAKDGTCMAACGVTMPSAGMTREQAVAKATAIAQAVEAGLGDCCCCQKK